MFRLVGILLTITLCREALGDAAVKPLFTSDATLSITLAGPLRSIANDKSDDPDYRPGLLQFVDTAGKAHALTVGLRPRGKSRRNPLACDFPPLRLDLPKKDAAGTVFDGQDKLKLVTQCQTRDPKHLYEQNVLKEYGLYRAFNRLSPLSFRVRLVEVSYVDQDRGDAQTSSFGFFIEDKADVAKRNQLHVADIVEVPPAQLEPAQANRVELFQFMIGNTDFSLRLGPPGEPCCHNAVPLLGDDGLYRPVPYDFDSTGVVDPPYALPARGLHINNVRQRRYRGGCEPLDVFQRTLDEFRAAQADLYASLLAHPGLKTRTVRTVSAYLDGFYSIINDPRQLQRQILSVCGK
jgi:hypothetical protein